MAVLQDAWFVSLWFSVRRCSLLFFSRMKREAACCVPPWNDFQKTSPRKVHPLFMFLNESLGYTETEKWYGHSECSMLQHVAACDFWQKKHFFQLEWSLRFSFITMNRCAKDLLSRQSLTAFSFNLFEAMAGVDLAHGDGSRRYSLPTWTTCLLQLAKQTQANGKMTVTKHKSTCWWWNMNDLFAKGRHLKVVVGGLFEGLNESQRHAEACTLLLRP